MIKGLNHIQISIPIGSEQQARAFYCNYMGLSEIEKPQPLRSRGGFWCELGGVQIHFGAEDGFDRKSTKAHPAFEVEDLEECRGMLRRLGIEAIDGIPIPGYDRFEFRDPFGNRIEIMRRL